MSLVYSLHKIFQDSDSIAIIGHVNPDADALCSALALKEFISNNYLTKNKNNKFCKKKVDIFIDCDHIPESLKIFAKKHELSINVKPRKKYDLAVAVDCLNLERLGKYSQVFENAENTLNIDHHLSNSKFAKNNLVMKFSSTCESLFSIFNYFQKFYGTQTNNYILTQIYAGLITDTNNLENNADTKTTRHNVAKLVEALGIKQASIIKSHFFQNIPKTKLALTTNSYKPKNRIYYEDGSICIITLNNKVFSSTKASLDDAEGIVDSALKTEGVAISALILEPKKNEYVVKLRGKNINVSNIAEKFNGGGHEYMAGFQFKGSYNILNMALLRECKKVLEKQIPEQITIQDILK